MNGIKCTDEFLQHVFPGSSEAMVSFRLKIEHLNHYCRRYKGAVKCILLTGETGVGKTRTARAISAHSQWLMLTGEEVSKFFDADTKKFLFPADKLINLMLGKEHRPSRERSQHVKRLATVLAPQLSDELVGSELFGHTKGAFTGAVKDHPGIFGDQSIEDVLIDEIADLSPKVQAKLLQFIDSGTFRPVGGLADDEKISEHRVFLATNQDLPTLVQKSRFREDLYHRIKGHQIVIPPLRARKEIIHELVYVILESVNYRHRGAEQVRPAFKEELAESKYCLLPESEWIERRETVSNWVVQLTEDDLRWCKDYEWPGNIRELKQRLEQYVFFNGHRRLRDLNPINNYQSLDLPSLVSCDHFSEQKIINQLVADYLQRVLQGLELPPGQPNELLSRFSQLIKSAVYAFKTEKKIRRKQWEKIFPAAKDPETTIGRWRLLP